MNPEMLSLCTMGRKGQAFRQQKFRKRIGSRISLKKRRQKAVGRREVENHGKKPRAGR